MTTKQLTILGFMMAQPGTEQDLLTQIDDLVAKTRAEPGCINYDFHQHTSEPQRFVFYENFVDQAAVDYHFAQPHTQAWIAFGILCMVIEPISALLPVVEKLVFFFILLSVLM